MSKTNGAKGKASAPSEPARSDSTKESLKVVPPDGGWGWMVVIGIALVNFLNFGHLRNFGLYVIPMMHLFQITPFQVALVSSIRASFFAFGGPVASTLVELWGPRPVAILGATFSCLGMALTSLSTCYLHLLLSSVLPALGISFVFIPAVQVVSQYFLKRRGVANGLTLAGNSLGAIVFPPLMEFLLREYGLRGTFLIIGAIIFNTCVGVLFWQPVRWHQKLVPVEEGGNVSDADAEECKPPNHDATDRSRSSMSRRQSSRSNGSRRISIVQNTDCGQAIIYDDQEEPETVSDSETNEQSKRSAEGGHNGDRQTGVMNQAFVNDTFQLGGIPQHDDEAKPPEKNNPKPKRPLFDFSILANPLFWIVGFGQMCQSVAHPGTRLFLPYRAQMLGYTSQQSAMLMSANAAADLTGRLFTSWLSDLNLCRRTLLYCGGMCMSAVMAYTLPLCFQYELLLCSSAAVGFFTGSFIGISTSVVADTFGAERVGMVISMVNILCGFAGIGGPPLLGYIIQKTNSYLACQFTAASIFAAGGAIYVFEPMAQRFSKKQREKAGKK